MKHKPVRWRLNQCEIDRLSSTLKPVRPRREVAGILGISVALVCQLESSALGKVARALRDFENSGKNETNETSNYE